MYHKLMACRLACVSQDCGVWPTDCGTIVFVTLTCFTVLLQPYSSCLPSPSSMAYHSHVQFVSYIVCITSFQEVFRCFVHIVYINTFCTLNNIFNCILVFLLHEYFLFPVWHFVMSAASTVKLSWFGNPRLPDDSCWGQC